MEVSSSVIEYIVGHVSVTVDISIECEHSTICRCRSISRNLPHGYNFATFVERVLNKAHLTLSIVLASLAYIDRVRPHLQLSCDSKFVPERVFLGATIVASKYLNESSLPNVHWARITGLFGKTDVGRIEREFLEVLDWELKLTEEDLLAHYDSLSLSSFPATPTSTPFRQHSLASPCSSRKSQFPTLFNCESPATISFPSPVH
ncbi:hypothetical protein GYMLUDRAFT_33344 [Collybiopsis luxurians FD-317 M1]|nr:hypothetical protein GYMLUDRAFT_33344 [Collybiopsis luxurians FD-317 M1]